MNWQKKFLRLTWEDFHTQGFQLSHMIAAEKKDLQLIVTIARGGLALSQILSDSLKLPIAAFTIESYKDLHQNSLPHITHGLTTSLNNKKILLVDEICDTGKTFLRGLAYLEELGAERKNITTCALYYKPHSEYKPDFFIGETSAWVIYPTEVRETIEALGSIWKKEGLSQEEIRARLASLGYSEDQITRFSQ